MLVILSVFLSVYFFTFSLNHPYIGALVNEKNGVYTIAETEPQTWSSRYLHAGDEIVTVNGEPPSDSKPIELWGMLEQVERLTIQHGETGEVETFEIYTKLDTQTIFQIIVPMIVFLLSLYCSFFIFKGYKPATKYSSMLLILFLLDFSLAYISGGASARGEFFARTFVTIFFLFVPILYMHFIYFYFKELNSVWFSVKWIWFSYGLALISFVTYLLSSLTKRSVFGIDVVLAKTLTLAFFMILFIVAISMIFVGLKKVKFKSQRYLIKMLIFTNVLAFLPFLLLYVFPYILVQKPVFSPVVLSSFLLIIPFSLVYQFLATKIFDIEFIVGRLRYYSLLSILPSIIGIFVIVMTKSDDATIFTIRGFLVILLVMFCGFYFKEVIDFKFKIKRFSEKHNYQDSIFAFTQKIRQYNEFEEVIEELKTSILDVLIVNEVHFLEITKDFKAINLCSDKGQMFEEYRDKVIHTTFEVGTIAEIEKGFIINIGETQQKNFIMIALSTIKTPKLSRDEISWLKTLSYYTNVTIESFLKIEHFMEHLEKVEEEGRNSIWLNRVIYQLEEKQRSMLAKDLHDSVLQELLSIKRKLELNTYEVQEDDCPDIEQVSEDLNKVISITRETCHELRPNILYDLGLEKALRKLVEQQIHATGLNIRFTSNKINEDMPSEIQLNLYRISQELLNNTKKHSNARNVVLMIVRIKDKIVLHYEDDGIGTNPDALFAKTGSMGLSGLRERVKMLNGTIDVKTSPNEGFKVMIEI